MNFPIVHLCVAPKMMSCFSFFICTLDDDFDIWPIVFFPISPLIASKMLNNFSLHCFEYNNDNEFEHELNNFVYSNFGVFVFPHLEDVENNCLHIDLAYALYYANGVVNKNGHVTLDMLLYHTQKYFAWSLSCEGTNSYSSSSMEHGLTKQAFESYLWMSLDELPRHRHYAKVISFYLRMYDITFKNWLLLSVALLFL